MSIKEGHVLTVPANHGGAPFGNAFKFLNHSGKNLVAGSIGASSSSPFI